MSFSWLRKDKGAGKAGGGGGDNKREVNTIDNVLEWVSSGAACSMLRDSGDRLCNEVKGLAQETKCSVLPKESIAQSKQGTGLTSSSTTVQPPEPKEPMDLQPIVGVIDYVFGSGTSKGNEDEAGNDNMNKTCDSMMCNGDDEEARKISSVVTMDSHTLMLSHEDQEILEYIQNGDMLEALLDLSVNAVNGMLDVSLLIVAAAVAEIGADAASGHFAFMVLIILLFWHWFMGNFYLPVYKCFWREEYFLWLGDPTWTCACGDECVASICGCDTSQDDKFSFFHPRYSIVFNFVISDVGFTLAAYFNGTFEQKREVFIAKALVAALAALFSLRAMCYEFGYSKKMFKLRQGRKV